jgi:hypothetical protein
VLGQVVLGAAVLQEPVRAVFAFSMVSAVVKVFEAMMNSVVSGLTCASAASMSWPSTLETKCIFRRGCA